MPPAAAEAEDRAEAAPTSNLALGRAAFEAGDYAEAAALLWRATEADESVRADADVQILRARAVMLSGRPEAAIAVFARVAEEGTAGSTLAEALYWRGEAEMMLGREDAAQDSFRLALDAQPGHALAEERLIGLAPAARPRAMAQASPEPGLIRVAATAPRSRPQPAPESESEPAPAEDAETTPPSDAELDAAAEDFRQQAEEARETGDDAAEARALSELYLTQRATDEEIEGYTELVRQTGSDDIGRDAQIAQLAGIAHHDLAVALYDAVEAAGTESGRVEGRNLAVLRTNWATALLDSGDAEAALETANAAVDADDTYGNAFGVRSLAQRELGDLGRALEDAKKAYDLGATAPRVLALLNAAGFAVGPDQAQLQTEAEASEAALRGSSD
jgi:tetratricopeptide (TPR) repeat protein